MLKELLSKLGANTKVTIGLSVSPGIGLEMIEIDKATNTVSKYACKPLEYNYSTREITDYDEFKISLNELFDELKISKKCNVILNLPNVHFGTIGLPLLLTDDAITNAIISEAEQSYIFKRQEPVISWSEISSNVDTENRELAYSAIQQGTLDSIKKVFEEVGCTLLGVETAYASLLKTLFYTDLAKEQMQDNITWNLMVIGQNSYSILSMVGKKIIDYYEEPLALKSFVDDEIYNAITSSSQITLQTLPANYLYIVSETDLVSSEVLSMKIPFGGQIKFLECNKYVQNELLPVNLNILPNLALKITPEAIGIGIYQLTSFPLKFNMIGSKDIASADTISITDATRLRLGNLEIELTPDFIKKISIIISSIVLIPSLLIYIFIGGGLKKEQDKLNEINNQIAQYNEEIKKYSDVNAGNMFDTASEINKIQSSDRSKLLYYSVLGLTVPSKLWLTSFMAVGEKGVDIKGKSTDVENIYSFYKGVKQLVRNSDVRLYKLQIVSNSIDEVIDETTTGPKFYEFEITNMTESELTPKTPEEKAAEEKAAADAAAAAKTEEKQGGMNFGQSIFKPRDGQRPQDGGPQAGGPPPAPGGEALPPNLEKIEKF